MAANRPWSAGRGHFDGSSAARSAEVRPTSDPLLCHVNPKLNSAEHKKNIPGDRRSPSPLPPRAPSPRDPSRPPCTPRRTMTRPPEILATACTTTGTYLCRRGAGEQRRMPPSAFGTGGGGNRGGRAGEGGGEGAPIAGDTQPPASPPVCLPGGKWRPSFPPGVMRNGRGNCISDHPNNDTALYPSPLPLSVCSSLGGTGGARAASARARRGAAYGSTRDKESLADEIVNLKNDLQVRLRGGGGWW